MCYVKIIVMVIIISFISALAVVGLDQLTKFLIYGTVARSIIGDVLWFQSTLNTGVAFSMFEGKSWIFIVISSLAALILIYLICSKKFLTNRSFKVCLGLILGGTIGNLIDRIFFHGVRDFIYFKFIDFAIFNIADAAIVVSVILFCIFVLIDTFKKENK